jgi:hypothetical protein
VNDHPTVHDLDEQAAVALAEARSMPPGPTRTEAIKRAGAFCSATFHGLFSAAYPRRIHRADSWDA